MEEGVPAARVYSEQDLEASELHPIAGGDAVELPFV